MKRIIDLLFDKVFIWQREPQPDWNPGKRALHLGWRLFALLCAGAAMSAVLLLFAYGQYSWNVFLSYLKSPQILILNAVPVMALILLLYGLLGRTWLAFLLGGGCALGLSLGHYYKLTFRNDPLYFEDMLILREAGNMATEQNYTPFVDKRVVFAAVCLLLGTLLLAAFAGGVLRGWKKRGAAALTAVLAGVCLWGVYMDNDLYERVGCYDDLNPWSPTEKYIAHGFVYPFIHSVTEFVNTPPEGYNARQAQTLLAQYEDADIPADRKVSVIAIMREAYVDLSRFDIDGLDTSGYDTYHRLQEESYSGDLLVNIFAGGTVDSERCFLTGNYALKNFRGSTNSYLWYLRDQGYTVEGSHPYYQWFYNRQNINSYLGFEHYRFLEGDYELLTDAPLVEDTVLYDEAFADYQAARATGKPYFSFLLNMQSHAPYSTVEYTGDRQYLAGNYSDGCKNAMNNYMRAIMDGDAALMELVERLRGDSEPVVLILFSDHLPWMGDGNVFYDEMGLTFDFDTEKGLRDYYTTEYLIWANDAAKEVLNNDFRGDGPTISPCFLMNVAFEQMGWEGPAFMQAMDEIRAVMPVVANTGIYEVEGAFYRTTVPPAYQPVMDRFRYLQYYWLNGPLQ